MEAWMPEMLLSHGESLLFDDGAEIAKRWHKLAVVLTWENLQNASLLFFLFVELCPPFSPLAEAFLKPSSSALVNFSELLHFGLIWDTSTHQSLLLLVTPKQRDFETLNQKDNLLSYPH